MLFATDDAEIDWTLTKAIFEIFWQHGLLLPAYIAITATGDIVLRPVHAWAT